MDLSDTTARLRRTFAYPSDATTPTTSHPDTDSEGPALDEQEQESLIQHLTQQNDTRNAQFRIFLLSVPLLSTIPYLTLLFSTRRPSDFWTALLALSSLSCTAWSLYALPPGVTGVKLLDAWVKSASPQPTDQIPTGANAQRRRRLSGTNTQIFWSQHRSPLEAYLPFLNLGLCAVLILTGLLSPKRVQEQHWGHVGLANLPAVVYAVVLIAKMVMGSVDPERELAALRYEYKGA
ncbi:hypothetical protein GGR57DRAFT_355819 [Xylariaceae sp. FL1272]|nr:hypothetical protein GGR57DRAFT_355819 [Xylariaceae sp. FL1272]